MKVFTVALVSTLTMTACNGPIPGDYEFDDSTGGDEDSRQQQQEIRSGVLGGASGAVEIGGCTGTMIGRHMILTAAHCFDGALGDNLDGEVRTRISYARSGTTWSCMTGSPSSGKCTADRQVWVYRLANESSEDAQTDMAVVFPWNRGAQWSNVTAADAAWGLYAGSVSSSEPYTLWGRGAEALDGGGTGQMRAMNDSLNWIGSKHFVTDASGTRVCNGDSGGPYYVRDTEWQFGIHSNSDKKKSGDICAEVGGKARGMRMTKERVDQINAFRADEWVPACTAISSAFPDFFVCQ